MNFNCFGGFNLTPIKGYWRYSSKSIKFLKCPNPHSCLGDPRNFAVSEYYPHYAIGKCAKGYTDVKCTVCAENWGITSKNTCAMCSDGMYYLKITINMLIKIFFCLYSVFIAINMSKSIMSNDKIEISSVASSNGIKIFNNHIQILSLLATLPFQFPLKFTYNLSIILSISPSDPGSAFSIECFLRKTIIGRQVCIISN